MDGYGYDMDAPRYPVVLPTLFYRTFVWFWWEPLQAFLVWAGSTTYERFWVDDAVRAAASKTATRVLAEFTKTVTSQETFEPGGSMYDDEVI